MTNFLLFLILFVLGFIAFLLLIILDVMVNGWNTTEDLPVKK